MPNDDEHHAPAVRRTDIPTPLDRADADDRIGPDANARGIESVTAAASADGSGATHNNPPRPL